MQKTVYTQNKIEIFTFKRCMVNINNKQVVENIKTTENKNLSIFFSCVLVLLKVINYK